MSGDSHKKIKYERINRNDSCIKLIESSYVSKLYSTNTTIKKLKNKTQEMISESSNKVVTESNERPSRFAVQQSFFVNSTKNIENSKKKFSFNNKLEKYLDKSDFGRELPFTSQKLPDIKIKPPQRNEKERSLTQETTYCPHCSHCNKIEDKNLSDHFLISKVAMQTIRKGVELTLNHGENKNLFNLILNNDQKQDDMYELLKMFDNLSKVITSKNRESNILMLNYMDALIENKISLENLLGKDLNNRLKEKSMMMEGLSFVTEKEEIVFDQEIESLFDEKTKAVITNIFKSKLQPK